MSPGRFDADPLEALRRGMGPLDFAAQYLQAPLPPEGAMVRREWLDHRYEDLPELRDGWECVQSWDVATTTRETSDYSVCTTRCRD